MEEARLDEETAKKVIRQVEFYFSDSNLPRDNFLRNTISESEDGMVSLALICSFSRMRSHLDLGDVKAEDVHEDKVQAVAATLRSSATLKISEDGKKVGRTTELSKPEEVIEQLDVRTIAASPIEYDVKLEEMESFFSQFAKVNSVRLPRHVADNRLFCGTALIEFSAEEDATRILTQKLVFGGVELELKPKKDFDAERANEEAENSHGKTDQNRKNNSNTEETYPKGLIVAFKLKNLSSLDSAAQNGNQEKPSDGVDVQKTNVEPESTEMVTEDADHKGSKDVSDGADVQETNVEPESTAMVTEDADHKGSDDVEKMQVEKPNEETDGKVEDKSKDVEKKQVEKPNEESDGKVEDKSKESKKGSADMYKDDMDVVLREDLKKVFQKFGNVKYIDFKMGEHSGYIRFEEAEGAQKARAAAVLAEEGGLTVKNFVATLDPVTGDAEKKYWNDFVGNQDKFRGNKSNWGRGGRNNRGGRHFNGKHNRSRGNDSGNRPNKFQKVGAA